MTPGLAGIHARTEIEGIKTEASSNKICNCNLYTTKEREWGEVCDEIFILGRPKDHESDGQDECLSA